jgi:hypothetical protein
MIRPGCTCQLSTSAAVGAAIQAPRASRLHHVFAWTLTRPVLQPVYRTVLIASFCSFGLLFGEWYLGIV